MWSRNGFFTLPAAELVDDASVYAIDVNEELLAERSGLAEARDLSNIACNYGDTQNLTNILLKPVYERVKTTDDIASILPAILRVSCQSLTKGPNYLHIEAAIWSNSQNTRS